MRVFLSWSGQKSKELAKALKDELPNFLQHVRPFFSQDDIRKGQLWQGALGEALDDIKFGIVCVTPENVDNPWIIFEAAALSKMVSSNRVAPLLFELAPEDVRNPLTILFQATECTKEDIKRLILSINESSPEGSRLETNRLDAVFERYWPDLVKRLHAISPSFGRTNVSKGQLSMTQSTQSVSYLGRPIVNVITVTNDSELAEDDVTLVAVPAAGFSVSDASDGGSVGGGRITWNLGRIAAKEKKSVKYRGSSSVAGTFSAFASAFKSAAVSTATFEVRGVDAILLEVTDDPDPVEVGTNTTYTITATNQGSAVGTNVAIECLLPAEEEYVSSGGATIGTSSGKTVTFPPLPSLAPKARATWTVTVKALEQGDVRFNVKMRTAEMQGKDVMETESTNIYQ